MTDQGLVARAVAITHGGKSRLARLMTRESIPTTRVSITNWATGKNGIRQYRTERRRWLIEYLREMRR